VPAPASVDLIHQGTPEFRRTNLALFSAGFATFALLYCVQPLMPVFAGDFKICAAQSSLALSFTTGLLAPAMIVAARAVRVAGESRYGWSLLASSLFTFLSAFVPH
jgi:YNFM family putative membrane transporter